MFCESTRESDGHSEVLWIRTACQANYIESRVSQIKLNFVSCCSFCTWWKMIYLFTDKDILQNIYWDIFLAKCRFAKIQRNAPIRWYFCVASESHWEIFALSPTFAQTSFNMNIFKIISTMLHVSKENENFNCSYKSIFLCGVIFFYPHSDMWTV